MEEAVTFKNEKGETLFGIVHIPENSKPDEKRPGINLLNPGIKYRVAPNRLNIKLARRLCKNGYYVFRFDPAGIGDSEGELPSGVFRLEIGEEIQNGFMVNDTKSANDFFLTNYPVDRLFLIGNCGGAITALLTSESDPLVDALCLIDVPVDLRTKKKTYADKVIAGGERAEWLFGEYMKNIFNPDSLFRFFTFKTDYKALIKILMMKTRQLIFPSAQDRIKNAENIDKLCRENILSGRFFKGIETVITRKAPVLFILAGNDPGTEIFQHYFQNMYLKNYVSKSIPDGFMDIFLIKNANHVYTLIECQEALIDKICSWTAQTVAR